MGKKIELKVARCPFCDSGNISIHRQYVSDLHWLVCEDCKSDGPAKMGEEDAITAWNTRAQPTPQDQGSLPDGWRPDREALTAIGRRLQAEHDATPSGFSKDFRWREWQAVLGVLTASAPPSVHAEKG